MVFRVNNYDGANGLSLKTSIILNRILSDLGYDYLS